MTTRSTRLLYAAFILSFLAAGLGYSFVTVTQQFVDGMRCIGCL